MNNYIYSLYVLLKYLYHLIIMFIMILISNRCKKNCRQHILVEESLELSLVGGNASLSVAWTISPDINWTRDSGLGNNTRVLSIYGNVLLPGAVYNVTVECESYI